MCVTPSLLTQGGSGACATVHAPQIHLLPWLTITSLGVLQLRQRLPVPPPTALIALYFFTDFALFWLTGQPPLFAGSRQVIGTPRKRKVNLPQCGKNKGCPPKQLWPEVTPRGRSHSDGEVHPSEKLVFLSLTLITKNNISVGRKAASVCAATPGEGGGCLLLLFLFSKLGVQVSYNATPAFWEHNDVSIPVPENVMRKIPNTL